MMMMIVSMMMMITIMMMMMMMMMMIVMEIAILEELRNWPLKLYQFEEDISQKGLDDHDYDISEKSLARKRIKIRF